MAEPDPTEAPEVAGRVPRLSDEVRSLMQEAYESWANLISATRHSPDEAWYKERVDEREAEHVAADDALSAYIAGLEAELALVAAADQHAAHVGTSSGTYSVKDIQRAFRAGWGQRAALAAMEKQDG